MSIEATYRRVTPERFAQLLADPEAAHSFFYPSLDFLGDPEQLIARMEQEEASGQVFNLGKEWHALHFLLTGESALERPSSIPPPLCNVVLGGTPTPFEATYGQVRSLSPNEVCAVAETLGKISTSELKRRFDPEAFNALQIYPNPRPGGWDEEQLEPLLELYPGLVEFFVRAAEAGEMVLLSSD